MSGRGEGDGEERERRDIMKRRGRREAVKSVLINQFRPGAVRLDFDGDAVVTSQQNDSEQRPTTSSKTQQTQQKC